MIGSANGDDATNTHAKKFIDAHVAKMKPLDMEAGIAWWDANTSGKDEDFARKQVLQINITRLRVGRT